MIGDNALGVFTLPQDILNTYAKVFSPESVQLYYQIVLEGIKEYSAAPDGKSAFEMTLLRLLAFSPEKKKNG